MFENKRYIKKKSLDKLKYFSTIDYWDIQYLGYTSILENVGNNYPLINKLVPIANIVIHHDHGDIETIRCIMLNKSFKVLEVYYNGIKVR